MPRGSAALPNLPPVASPGQWRPRTISSGGYNTWNRGGCAERQAARRKRQQLSQGEILQTFLAYKLDNAAEKMGLGIAIGDPLTLLHEPTNQWDGNAVKVFWKGEWIGFIPKDM